MIACQRTTKTTMETPEQNPARADFCVALACRPFGRFFFWSAFSPFLSLAHVGFLSPVLRLCCRHAPHPHMAPLITQGPAPFCRSRPEPSLSIEIHSTPFTAFRAPALPSKIHRQRWKKFLLKCDGAKKQIPLRMGRGLAQFGGGRADDQRNTTRMIKKPKCAPLESENTCFYATRERS